MTITPKTDYCFRSVAIERTAPLDFADVHLARIPPFTTDDPSWWATRIFGTATMPAWVTALLGIRQAVVGLVGIEREKEDVFDVREVVGREALICKQARHLDFRVGVAVTDRVLRVTTAVSLHGWRGRLYWSVTRLFHGLVTESMIRRAVRLASL